MAVNGEAFKESYGPGLGTIGFNRAEQVPLLVHLAKGSSCGIVRRVAGANG